MSVQTRAYDGPAGTPVVVVVVEGSHDVSRLVHLFSRGNCEQIRVGHRIARALRRHNRGRAALALLKQHGGADFTDETNGASVKTDLNAVHLYTSTYCIHDNHSDCRFSCKTCKAPCLCSCHLLEVGP